MTWLTVAWKFRNEIAIGAIILALVSLGFYFRYVLNDRQELKEELKQLHTEVEQVKKQITLNEDIANAIKKIKIQSNNYVSVVESSPTPEAGSSFVAVPSGVFRPAGMLPSSSSRDIPPNNAGTKDRTN